MELTLHQVEEGFDLFGGDAAEDDPIDGLLNELEQEQPSTAPLEDNPFDFSEEDVAPPAEQAPLEQTPFDPGPFEQEPFESEPLEQEPEAEEIAPPTLQIPPREPETDYYSPPEKFEPPAESEPAAPRYNIYPDETCDDHEASCRRFETEPFGRKLASLDAVSILSPNLEGELGGAYPCSCRLPDEDHTARDYAQTVWEWNASAACHKPLYFEQQRLERYGHTIPIAHYALTHAEFYATLPVLPYKMGMYPPWECRYALGYHRPGNCAPYLVPPVPLSWRGAAAQAGAVLGVNYIIP